MSDKKRQDGLDYIEVEPPSPATLVEVAPGVHWVRMPLPIDLDHINLWLLEDEAENGAKTWTAVDTGMATAKTRDIWTELLNGPAKHRQLTRLIVTHYHPDHCGLAGWLRETYGVEVCMTEMEWITANLLRRVPSEEFSANQDRYFKRHGVGEETRAFHRENGNPYMQGVGQPPDRVTRMKDGERIAIGNRYWQVITATGHAPELACLYNEEMGVLISGDQILPQITPIVSVWWYKAGIRPLEDFLESIQKLRDLPDETLVLPSHRQPFRGLRRRVDQLQRHHDDRLDDLRRALIDKRPYSVADLVPALFKRSLNHWGMIFAIGEAAAHVEHLTMLGEITEQEMDDGRSFYCATPKIQQLGAAPDTDASNAAAERLHE